MDCKQTRTLLGAYVDGELDARSVLEVEDHARGCPTCSSALLSLRSTKHAVQSATYYRAPQNVVAAIRAQQKRESAPSWSPARTLALAACLFIALAGGWFLGRRSLATTASINSEVVTAHIRALMANHLIDVVSSDQHTVKPWFAGRVDFVPPVVDYKSEGFPLMGGRMEFIDGHRTAVIVYARRKHVIDLLTYPTTQDAPLVQSSERGFSAAHWATGGLDYSVVSGLNQADLKEFIDLVRSGKKPAPTERQ